MSVMYPQAEAAVPPGNPAMLRDAAGLLAAAAEVFDTVAAGFQRAMDVCDSGTWFGVAGLAYRIRVGETRGAVRIAGSSFREAAAALAHLADQLELAQHRGRTAHASAESASGIITLANTALVDILAQQEPDPQERLRLQRSLDEAQDDLTAAQFVGRSAYQEAVEAAQAAAAALDQATSNAKAPPEPPDPDMEPTETPSQFLRRQFSDVAIDTINPFPAWLSRWREGRITADWITGLALGGTEGISEGYVRNAKTYLPGYWAKMPTAVSGYVRTLPSGRKVQVAPYFRRDGVYVPGRTVTDVEKQAVHRQRAKLAKFGGFGLGFILAGVDQLVEDQQRRDLDGGERATRAVLASVAVGGVSMGGAMVGTAAGAVGGPVGTVGGGFYGGMVGSGIGDKVKGGLFKWRHVD